MKKIIFAFFLFLLPVLVMADVTLDAQKEQVSNGEQFNINVMISDHDDFQSLSFTLSFDKTRFTGVDSIQDIPDGTTDGQISIGSIFGSEYGMVRNEIDNTAGKIYFSINDAGVGDIEGSVLAASAKFECISQTISQATFTLSDIILDGTTQEASDTLNIYVGMESITTIGQSGGTATGSGGVTLTFPENAVLSDVSVTIDQISATALPAVFPATYDLMPTTLAWKFGPDMYFRRPVTVEITYQDSDLAGGDEADLKLYWLNPTVNRWERLNGFVDEDNNKFSCQIMHFSHFLLVADDYQNEHIRLSRVDAYPNPFSPNDNGKNDKTTISFHVSKDAKESTLKIFDVNGRLLHMLFEDKYQEKGENHYEWDGRNTYGELLPTGIYIYYIAVRDYQNRLDETKKTIVISRHMNE